MRKTSALIINGAKEKNAGRKNSSPVRSASKPVVNQPVSLSQQNSRPQSRALVEELKQKLKPMLFSNFKNLRVYDAKGDTTKEWYIEYHYLIPGTDSYKRIKERFDMNRITSAIERRTYANYCLEFMKQKLRDGFNPFEAVKVIGQKEDFRILVQLQKIQNGFSFNATDAAKAAYTEHYNRFKKFVELKRLIELYMVEINIDHAKAYKKYLLYECGLAIKTVNASLSYMAGYWSEAIEKKWVNANPFLSVPRAKKKEQAIDPDAIERFEPLTGTELDAIFKTLKEKKEIDFIRYIVFIFYAWARPAEIARLKVGDIDLNRDLIHFQRKITKNQKPAFVQIVPPLKRMLLQMNLENYPMDHFLFSGNGNGFLPGRKKLSRDRARDRWRAIVKDELGVNKDMYALKHTGNIEYLLQNVGKVDLKWQQMQNRHSTSAMTDRYNRKLGIYLIAVGELNYKLFQI
jgi:integrase